MTNLDREDFKMNYRRWLIFLPILALNMPLWADDPALLALQINKKLEEVKTSEQAWNQALQEGSERAVFCAVCHGKDGNGTGKQGNDIVPKLAGQNPVYLLDQFQQFAEGHRKSPPYNVMQELAANFTEEDKLNLVVYYAHTPRTPGQSTDPELAERGRQMYFKLCQHCHGSHGMGSRGYANIAAQHSRYIAKTLSDFRDGHGDRNNPLMASITHNLTDGEILELAAFIESLPPLGPAGGE
jgi:cytochrome c553